MCRNEASHVPTGVRETSDLTQRGPHIARFIGFLSDNWLRELNCYVERPLRTSH